MLATRADLETELRIDADWHEMLATLDERERDAAARSELARRIFALGWLAGGSSVLERQLRRIHPFRQPAPRLVEEFLLPEPEVV